jgi:CBS domain-containing protein
LRIEEIMSKPAITCTQTETLNTAARLMWENDCGVVPVVDGAGKLVGMVTDRDVCMAAYTQGKPLSAIPVSTAMGRHVFWCRPDESVEAAERLMGERQVRRVPVADAGGRPIGLLSLNDLARAAASSKTDVAETGMVKTLAAICGPRPKRAPATHPATSPAAQAQVVAAG